MAKHQIKPTALSEFSYELFAQSNQPGNPIFDAAVAIQISEFALRFARQQLVTLGGDGTSGDTIQKAVIDQIDTALERK